MSRHHAQVVRKPLSVRKSSSRPLDAQLVVRFPRLATAWGRLILRLAPTSRLRQALVWRAAQNGMEAFNRRDIDAAVMPGSADFEMRPPQEFVEMGFEPCYRGPAGLGQYMSAWEDVFADLRVEPVELIDLGDRIVLLADLPGRGQSSGVPFTGQVATVSVLKDGAVISVQAYLHHAQALEAVGLGE